MSKLYKSVADAKRKLQALLDTNDEAWKQFHIDAARARGEDV